MAKLELNIDRPVHHGVASRQKGQLQENREYRLFASYLFPEYLEVFFLLLDLDTVEMTFFLFTFSATLKPQSFLRSSRVGYFLYCPVRIALSAWAISLSRLGNCRITSLGFVKDSK